jgi:transcriptional regulator with XRE-family HTH domain
MKRDVLWSVHRKRLGEAIRKRRKIRKLSQEDLAELVDCHRNYVGNVERGEQNLTVDMLVRFAGALEVKTAQLMSGLPVFLMSIPLLLE